MYNALAAYYDIFMGEEIYGTYSRVYFPLIKGKNGADIGCGSGRFSVKLLEKGYEVILIDPSSEMLDEARDRCLKNGYSPLFIMQNAEELSLNRPVDFITAVCDVVNYIKKPAQFFSAAYKNLKAGGKLLFDISTEYKIKNIIGGNVFTEEKDGVIYIWKNIPFKGGIDSELIFFEKEESGLYRRSGETQRMYAHSASDIIKSLETAGFTGIKAFDSDGRAPSQKKDRIFFAAEK